MNQMKYQLDTHLAKPHPFVLSEMLGFQNCSRACPHADCEDPDTRFIRGVLRGSLVYLVILPVSQTISIYCSEYFSSAELLDACHCIIFHFILNARQNRSDIPPR